MKRSISTSVLTVAIGVVFFGGEIVNNQSSSYGQDNDGWYGYVMRSGGWGPQGYYQSNPYNQSDFNYSGYGNGAYGYGTTYPYQNSYYNGYGYGGAPDRSVFYYSGGSDPSFGNNGYDRSSYRYFQRGSAYSRF